MSSPDDRIPIHDLPPEAGSDERLLHITPGTLTLDFKPHSAVDIDQQIMELKKSQELQKQRLLLTFQEQSKKMELEHKLQLEHKYQELRNESMVTAAAAAAEEQHRQQQHQQQQQQQQHQQQQQQQHQQQQQQQGRGRDGMKPKQICSANASPEVKQILNCFIMNRKSQVAQSNGTTTSPYRNRGVVKSSSGESLPAGTVTSAHPYKIPQPPSSMQKYESDFPLRKTASEPNLLKIRLKQSVIERKARIGGPAGARRHERLLQAAQRRQQKNSVLTNCNSTPDSGPNSPPSAAALAVGVVGSRGSPTSAPIQEENEEGSQYQPGQRSSINDLPLFSSPSLPNISLGRPHLPNSAQAHAQVAAQAQAQAQVAQAQAHAMFAALHQHVAAAQGGCGQPAYYNPLGMAFVGRQPAPLAMIPATGIAPQQPSPVVRSASATSTSSSQASLVGDVAPPQAHAASTILPSSSSYMQQLGGVAGSAVNLRAAAVAAAAAAAAAAGSLPPTNSHGHGHATHGAHAHAHGHGHGHALYGGHQHNVPITDAQVAQVHLHKQGHRTLGRTQSAPLPLGHPMLTGSGQLNVVQTHYENSEAERQAYEHQVLNQKLRQTVLTRSGAAAAAAAAAGVNVVREAQLKEEDDDSAAEVMDLTDKKKPPKTVLTSTIATSTSQNLPEALAAAVAAAAYRAPPSTPLSSNSASASNSGFKLRDQEYLQQQRELLLLQQEEELSKGPMTPLSRTLSSPLVPLGPHGLSQIPDTGQHPAPIATSSSADHIPPVNLSLPHRQHRQLMSTLYASHLRNHQQPPASGSPPHKVTTGLAYDPLMLKHSCICGDNAQHPEHSGRLQSVWARLNETDLVKRCDRLRARKATQEELQTVHTEAHAMLFGSNQCQLSRPKLENTLSASFVRLSCGGLGVDLDTTWNEHHTATAARMAAGCVIDLALKTAKGDLRNGFAVVRPPGHHAEANLAMGFCFFNSIAIAAKLLRQRMPEVRRILIVDWDVHHGNGTQQAFYQSPDILYLSIHRHDDGNFFPGTGGPTECGSGAGLGFNVNISWSGALNPPLGDAEYIAAFRTVVMPIARSFNPDIVLVSSGFDAATGHPAPLGGYHVSPACFGFMTRELLQLANGKVVLALEGGYDLAAICDSAQECVRALLGDPAAPIAKAELERPPCQNAINTLQKTIAIQQTHWPCVRMLEHTVGLSALETLKVEHDESETINAMAGLSMQSMHRTLSRDDSEEPMDQDETK
ncbi:histone deacetylase 4 isoform X2 [Drosophila biarmipes]|uniref:histone deacetylase 4 isoform X2 n=1 Tax=Drosophila biarmipes TaxID=125945 RepID=UPI001CDADD0B|nr:histone deacetylase 4 isoform X2 [Drosophila biarmipes]